MKPLRNDDGLRLLAIAACLLGLVGCQPDPSSASASRVLGQYPELGRFFEEKEQQARADTRAAQEGVSAEAWDFFAAARKGDWARARNLWKGLASRSGQYEGTKPDRTVQTAAWQPLLEADLALEAFAEGDPEYAALFGRAIVESIPRGSIYFGGTDPGRGLVTAFSKSHREGDPFFTLTQNALADGSYLEYLRRMYGGKLYVPTSEDSQHAFTDYLNDAERRLRHDRQFPDEPRQIKPGEDVRWVENRVQVQGQVAVMAINARLAKTIFEKNPTRDFFIEESFPLDWMYPHLAPHGLILKVERAPLPVLPEEVLKKDREYWTRQVDAWLGAWLRPETPVADVAAFAQRIHGEKDFASFQGARAFVQDNRACKSFSKLRSAIGGVYAWRSANASAETEKPRMLAEADFAFRQAWALCPTSPEAVYRCANLLLGAGRKDDALLVADTAARLDPSNPSFGHLCRELQRASSGR